jgi:RNA polymerase sigma factor (sigma-70 family)
MHLATTVTDADLLSRYLREGDEGAFSSLVQMHERMVIGTAWRHTGDSELARDVAQQVFATLANKAALLAGRKSLAGWLHIAATHLAARTRAAETARRNRQEQAAVHSVERVNEDAGPLLEEALSSLGGAEREALVLHYFEDRSYAEMADVLGLQEAAVRKRVSRGLEHLGALLRRRGFRGSTVAALVGASAMQAGIPGTVVAGTALALPAVTGSSSFALTFATLMGNTAFKISAAVVLASAIPIAWQSHANSTIRTEITEARRSAEAIAATPAAAAMDTTSLRAEVAELTESLAASRRKGETVKASLAESQRTLEQMQQEVLVKFGKSEDLARTFAAKIDEILPVISALEKKEFPLDAATTEKLQHATKVAMELLPHLGQLRKMDEEPEQAARFASTLMKEVMKLSPETTSALESTIAEGYTDLKRSGLTLSSRPKDNSEEWSERRHAADKALTARVVAILPESARNHPIMELIGDDAGILLPPEAAMLGQFPGIGGKDVQLKPDRSEVKPSTPGNQP